MNEKGKQKTKILIIAYIIWIQNVNRDKKQKVNKVFVHNFQGLPGKKKVL